MAIDRFQGEHRYLSNFWQCPLTIGGIVYPTAEHAYQASKTLDVGVRTLIAGLPTPGEAKRAGRRIDLRINWEGQKKRIMLLVLLTKFTDNMDLGKRLAATGDETLTEGNTWHDNYWGQCHCARCEGYGFNYLGVLLMAVRDVVRVD
jgi:N-glycosidase YbiA